MFLLYRELLPPQTGTTARVYLQCVDLIKIDSIELTRTSHVALFYGDVQQYALLEQVRDH